MGRKKTDRSKVEKPTDKLARPQIAHDLRAFRRETLGISQRELAEKSGVSSSTIVSIETGRHTPSLDILTRIAFPFGYNVTYFKTDKGENTAIFDKL